MLWQVRVDVVSWMLWTSGAGEAPLNVDLVALGDDPGQHERGLGLVDRNKRA